MDKSRDNIENMFNDIAPKYDVLNHILSMGIDREWRDKVVKEVSQHHPREILDVAAGTCDLSIAIAKGCKDAHITAVDLSGEMLQVGRLKVKREDLEKQIDIEKQDATEMSFQDGSVDVLTVAFGVRNFEDLDKGLREFHRVLREDGHLYILEFSKPRKGFFSVVYSLYFKHLLPFIGGVISNNKRAYTYLPASVLSFPYGEEFEAKLREVGFRDVKSKQLTFGIATLYSAKY
ncbi:MAG: bifunctional demethylmenaquinone methyltransferase/2-methoxy-6-polyprenyl-1,4-benzoquinol methylase UbiE [Rikenellaceae bacterium]